MCHGNKLEARRVAEVIENWEVNTGVWVSFETFYALNSTIKICSLQILYFFKKICLHTLFFSFPWNFHFLLLMPGKNLFFPQNINKDKYHMTSLIGGLHRNKVN